MAQLNSILSPAHTIERAIPIRVHAVWAYIGGLGCYVQCGELNVHASAPVLLSEDTCIEHISCPAEEEAKR